MSGKPFRCAVCLFYGVVPTFPLLKECPNCGASMLQIADAIYGRNTHIMARSVIPENVRGKITDRLSVFLMAAQNAGENSPQTARVQGIVWTLGAVGLDRGLVTAIVTEAAGNAGLDAEDTLANLGNTLPAARKTRDDGK